MFAEMAPSSSNFFVAPDRRIKCLHCDKIFSTIGSSRRHYREVHAQTSKLECQFCGTTFGRRENLQRHLSKYCSVSKNEYPVIIDQ